jgi:hypothetical protein
VLELPCVGESFRRADTPSKNPKYSIRIIISVLIMNGNKSESLIRQYTGRKRTKLNDSLEVLKLNIKKYVLVALTGIKITQLSFWIRYHEVCWIPIDVSEESAASVFKMEK